MLCHSTTDSGQTLVQTIHFTTNTVTSQGSRHYLEFGHARVYVLQSMAMYMAVGSLHSHTVQEGNCTNCIVHMYCTNGMGSLHSHTVQAWYYTHIRDYGIVHIYCTNGMGLV